MVGAETQNGKKTQGLCPGGIHNLIGVQLPDNEVLLPSYRERAQGAPGNSSEKEASQA